NLGRIATIRELTGRSVGFSDHTIGIAATAAAVALGAAVIEKHVTWSREAPGPDHAMSLALDEASEWVAQVRGVAPGGTDAATSEAEQANKAVVRKALYAARDLEAGAVVGERDLVALRPLEDGIPVSERDTVVGATVVRTIATGERLTRNDIARNDA